MMIVLYGFILFLRIGGFNGKAVVPYGGESSHRFQDKGHLENLNRLSSQLLNLNSYTIGDADGYKFAPRYHQHQNSEDYLRPRKIDRPKYEPYVEPETIPVYFPVYDDGYTNPEQRSGKAASAEYEDTPLVSQYQEFIMNFFDQKTHKILNALSTQGKVSDGDMRQVRIYGDTDVKNVSQSLLENDQVSYGVLRQTPHGRHLLLVTLLEGFDVDYWEPRCGSYVKMYLPDSLKLPNQPTPPADACILHEVTLNGRVVNRAEILDYYHSKIVSSIGKMEEFSRFHTGDQNAVNSLVRWCLDQDSFDSMLSLLVVIRDSCNNKLFTEAMFTIIQARNDVGFVLPSLSSIDPLDYLPFHNRSSDVSEIYENHRVKRQSQSVISFRGAQRTYPPSEPESRIWYFREDVLINTMHASWHIIMSGSNSRMSLERRGEMFAYMHGQVLHRYNCERLANGLGLTEEFGPRHWPQGIWPGYDSQLGSVINGQRYPGRPAGATITGFNGLRQNTERLNAAIDRLDLGRNRLGYAQGVDFGISPLGDVVEAYGSNNQYGGPHNSGHVRIATAGNSGTGVMGFPQTSMRDPIFYRWHTFIENFFLRYKERLGPYPSADLDFPEVQVDNFWVTSQGQNNVIRTFYDVGTVSLDGNLLRSLGVGNIQYERLNNQGYTFNMQINSSVATPAIGRIFLVPSQFRNNAQSVFIQMDLFYINLRQGQNTLTRSPNESPLHSTAPPVLRDLQNGLLRGMSETTFNYAHCGWPIENAIPRGTTQGMQFDMVLFISKVNERDSQNVNDWLTRGMNSWAWCGVRQGGLPPDSKPMGYPLDRNWDLDVLMRRSNARLTPISIVHEGN
ncbi:hemocyanin F chain [Eurytemora carolleeae]|uniref:hemocyanin F chain n=1 Tax=Eurytemora carolleeae TaxID=1294199 RepID=UPI000C778736|nr:hemocyanin F chain [Eurytemora carolleeae]|eukprot:XP_023344481.1 hemocyanin F chain-like [Eurytemora affinis]